MKKKIGIMGGTFDPIHVGHLILGETAYEQFHLDQVLFMPAGNPPHKTDREGRATDAQRTEMVRRAISENPHFSLSMEDMNPEGYSYTFRTLERLQAQNPDTEYYFIIGADSLFDFDGWKEPGRICKAAHLLVAIRDHVDLKKMYREMERLSEKYDGLFSTLGCPNLDVSSHMLRGWIAQGKSVRYYLPDSVYDYIKEEGIYLG